MEADALDLDVGARVDGVRLLNGNRALYEAFWKSGGQTRIYVQHSSSEDAQAGQFKRLIRQVILRLALRRVDAVIRVCDAALPAHWRPGRVFTVHNGVDLSEFPCRDTWRTDAQTPFTLLMVGAVNANKGQRLAIEALQHLPGVRLVIVGDGEERPALQALARCLGVAGQVQWAGQQADTSAYYRQADAFLMLSRFEAMPFVVLEAMASGTPVVACAVGGVPEAVEHGRNGVLLPERTSAALVAQVRSLMADPKQARSLGREARCTVESRFTSEHMVQGFLDVVREVRRRKGLEAGV